MSAYVSMEGAEGGGSVRNSGWKGYVAASGILLGLVGCVIQWTQPMEKWHIRSQTLINSYGTYQLFLLAVAAVNTFAHVKGRMELLWVSLALTLDIIDTTICLTDAFWRDSEWLIAAYGLSIAGALLSFVVFPFSLKGLSGSKVRLGVQVFFSVLLLIGSILLWTSGSLCTATGITAPHQSGTPVVMTGTQAHSTNAIMIAVVYLASTISGYTAGLELAFMYGILNIASYQPFGEIMPNSAWKCHDSKCKAGLFLITITLLAMMVYHLVVTCKSAATESLSGRAIGEFVKSKLAVVILSAIFCFTGMVMVVATKENDKHSTAQEAWSVSTLFVVSILMVVVELKQHKGCAVAAFCLMFSVIDYAVGRSGTNIGILGHPNSVPIRIGYIFLFLFSFVSFYALPCDWKGEVRMEELKQGPVLAGVIVFMSVVYLWSVLAYEASIGMAAIVLLICLLRKFEYGLNWVYFVFLLQLPRLTPFTGSMPGSVTSLYSGVNKVIILVILLAVLQYISFHVGRFGTSAFSDMRLFDDDSCEAEHGDDARETPFLNNAAPVGGDNAQVDYGTGPAASSHAEVCLAVQSHHPALHHAHAQDGYATIPPSAVVAQAE